MSRYFQWIILSSLTGSPIGSIAILVVLWYGADRFTLGLIPSPWRAFNRWRRQSRLRNLISINSADRRSRLELGELLVNRGRYAAAVDVLKPNLEAGDDDATTLFVLGVACLGSGRTSQGEVFLEAARERDPSYRLGGIDLELGRWRLSRGDSKGAREALERFCSVRHGTVEGKVLLARALAAEKDLAGARRWREAAWSDYASSPGFQRRQERFWAWRARPSRPLTYLALALACGFVFSQWVAPALVQHGGRHPAASSARMEPDE
jgi:tetratricopeptide (TPR) repeat protein